MSERVIRAVPMTAFYPRRAAFEHFATFYRVNSDDTRRVSYADWAAHVGLPLVAGVGVWLLNLRLSTVTPLLTGAGIATGFLFGLLWQIFNVGVKLKENGWAAGSRPAQLAQETLANASWAALTALFLSALLVGTALFDTSKHGVWSWTTAVIVALTAHFGLTLFSILGRFRQLFDAARDVR